MTFAEASGAALLATILDLSDVLLLTKECNFKFADPAKKCLTYEGLLKPEEVENVKQELREKQKINFPMNVTLSNENGKVAGTASLLYYLRAGSTAIIKNSQTTL